MYNMMTQSKGLVSHGVSTCQGCGLELIMRNVMKIMGEDTIIVIPPGCAATFSGSGREGGLKIPGIQGNLENTAAIASGIANGLLQQGNTHTKVMGFAGDGGTIDIGLQSLSGAMERNDNILYICYDNEAYMNTGVQGSGSTTMWASTTTTPAGKLGASKDLFRIAVAHNVPYAATASVADLRDLQKKVQKAKDLYGTRVLHIHCPCPTGWGYDPSKTIEIARQAVQSGAWLLLEYENDNIALTKEPKQLGDVADYMKAQKRFRQVSTQQIADISSEIIRRYSLLKNSANL